MYLTFNNLEDFLTHLHHLSLQTIHADISTTTGEPGQFGVQSITYHAALTVRNGDYIATTSQLLVHTTTLHLQNDTEKATVREKMFRRFDDLVSDLNHQGFHIERGLWQLQPPAYLKNF